MQNEFKRLRAGQPSIKFSTLRAKVSLPEKDDQIEGWDAALQAAKAEFGYQNARVVHLELLKKYGKEAWIAHNQTLTFEKEYLEREQEEMKIAVNEVNFFRKKEHEKAGNKLRAMEGKFWELLGRSTAVEGALENMKEQKKRLRQDE